MGPKIYSHSLQFINLSHQQIITFHKNINLDCMLQTLLLIFLGSDDLVEFKIGLMSFCFIALSTSNIAN